MPRSIKKGPFVDQHLIDKCNKVKSSKSRELIKTYSRRSVILPDFVGLNMAVHNGKNFVPVHITENMVGYKCGEFSPTRTYRGHTSKDDKKGRKG